jgi:hypothetical protein
MRKHIMHCSHFVSFEDFVFLTLGPLENGVYYKTDYHEKLKNRERNSCRLEYKKALEMIVAFPEFDKWLFGGKGPEVGKSFVEEIVGENYFNITESPSGYIRTLYRIIDILDIVEV